MQHSGVRVEKETVAKKIHFLVDVDPEFVSLVRHGANQQPFRVIKSEQKGGDTVGMIVQSILLPDGTRLDDLAAKEGLGWLSDVRTDQATQHGGYAKLKQMAEEEFEPTSLNLVKLDASGTYAMVGSLKDPEKAKHSLALGRIEKQKLIDVPTSPMAQPVAEEIRPNYVVTFGEMFDKELSSFLDVVRGALSQTGSDAAKRKKMVMNALDAFKSFLVIGMDAVGTEKVDTIKETSSKEETEMFKDKEEFAAAVGEVISLTVPELISDSLKAFGEELRKELVPEPVEGTPAETPPAEDKTPEDSLRVDELAQKVDKLTETVDRLANQLRTEPAASEDQDEPPRKEEKPTELPKVEGGRAEDGTFSGILFNVA